MKHNLNSFDHLKTRDHHVHAPRTRDADRRMEDSIHAALSLGLDEIGFLAPVEAGILGSAGSWFSDPELLAFHQVGCALRDQYDACITITLGVELGWNPDAAPDLLAVVARHPWDRIALACHYLSDNDGHVDLASRASRRRLAALDSLETTLRYYAGLRDAIPIVVPDMICHLDLIRTHVEDRSNDPRVKAVIRQVLVEMERAGTALEVSTAGYDVVDEPYPAAWILREAVEMGIELVLGSESENPSDVGRYFDSAVFHIQDALAGIHLVRGLRKPAPHVRAA